jgi:hypothetical protein
MSPSSNRPDDAGDYRQARVKGTCEDLCLPPNSQRRMDPPRYLSLPHVTQNDSVRDGKGQETAVIRVLKATACRQAPSFLLEGFARVQVDTGRDRPVEDWRRACIPYGWCGSHPA